MSEAKSAAAARLKNCGFDIWDIYSEKTSSTIITFENNKVDKVVSGIDSGIGARGLRDFKTYYAYVNEEEKLEEAVKTFAKGPPAAAPHCFTQKKPLFTNKISIDPFSVEVSEKIKILREMNSLARGVDSRVSQVNLTFSEKLQEVEVINDTGHISRENRVYTTFLVLVIAANEGRIETAYRAVSEYAGYELMNRDLIAGKTEEAAFSAARLLDTDKKISGEMPAVLSSSAGGTLIHEAVGHSLEADIVQKGMSGYAEKKGQKVASDIVSVVDDAALPNMRGSFSFDDEGIEAQKTVLIEKGVLKNYLYDRETALKDKASPTGNGRRENYRFRPIPRMTNTMIAPGKGAPEGLIKDTKKGIFIKTMGGGQVNTVTGEFIFEVKEAYLIENGTAGAPVRDATLLGTGPDVLNNIDAVCSDLGFEVGTCGKDGQGVPVSDAQPTIRIPKILIGSK